MSTALTGRSVTYVLISVRVLVSHSLADLSKEPVRKCDQSADFESEVIVFWCPCSLSDSFRHVPVCTCQTKQNLKMHSMIELTEKHVPTHTIK
jgi:hypothetical protein